jgi:hypothetical protein
VANVVFLESGERREIVLKGSKDVSDGVVGSVENVIRKLQHEQSKLQAEFDKERAEHPTFTEDQIWQIVRDHQSKELKPKEIEGYSVVGGPFESKLSEEEWPSDFFWDVFYFLKDAGFDPHEAHLNSSLLSLDDDESNFLNRLMKEKDEREGFDKEDRVYGERTKYYLLHASNHVRAVMLMKEIMWPLGDEDGTFDFSGESQGVLISRVPKTRRTPPSMNRISLNRTGAGLFLQNWKSLWAVGRMSDMNTDSIIMGTNKRKTRSPQYRILLKLTSSSILC